MKDVIQKRIHNFNAGPSALPLPVLEELQQELTNYHNTGMSVMEMSHRSKEFLLIIEDAKNTLRELMNIPDNYDILFIQGGASLQFSMIPMNFLAPNQVATYLLSGVWSKKALGEAKKVGNTSVLATSEITNFTHIPAFAESTIHPDSAYIHLTSNNTIYGTQWQDFPRIEHYPVIADMSSDILSREFDITKFAMIYAGAQKNLGPAGVTLVILRKDLLERIPAGLPSMLDYRTYSKNNSLYNTPPSYSIYVLGKVLKWIKDIGGVSAIQQQNVEKTTLLYNVIDRSNGYYRPHATQDSRSRMNITFTLPSKELETLFLEEAKNNNFIGLAGHRSVGGCRISTYNAVPYESCVELARFMEKFQFEHPCR